MNYWDEFKGLLQDWKRLSWLERVAIEAGNWAALAQLHLEKASLQQHLSAINPQDDVPVALAQERQTLVEELIALERANATVLGSQRSRLEEQRAKSASLRRLLGRVRQSYSPAALPLWQSSC